MAGPLSGRAVGPACPSFVGKAPDVLLWQHYLSYASKSIVASSTDPAHAQMWESTVPAIAFCELTASHAMMAFSALSLSCKTSRDVTLYDFRATADFHYYQCLAHLRASASVLDEVSADAVLASAMILIPCGLALAQTSTLKYPVYDWIYHLRGFRALGVAIYGEVQHAGQYRLIPFPQAGIPDAVSHEPNLGGGALWGYGVLLFHRIRESQSAALDSLEAANADSCNQRDAADIKASTAAIEALRYVMKYTLECRVSNLFRAVFTWPIQISSRAIELGCRRDPFALAIYAHWLVLTMLLEDLWWIDSFGQDRIERISLESEQADKPYAHLIRWPVKMRRMWRSLRA